MDTTMKTIEFNSVEDYLIKYGLVFGGVEYESINFQSSSCQIKGHIFRPKQAIASVVLLHGYMNHTSQLKHLIQFLTERNYAVAVFDLPGHGLSSGKRGDIENFSQYTIALQDFIKHAQQKLPSPYNTIGFSTGASVVIDYLLTDNSDIIDKVILAAPLVRYFGFQKANPLLKFYSALGRDLPRIPQNVTSDTSYKKLVNKDKLQVKWVPVNWVNALHQWLDKIEKLSPSQKPIKIIQGTLDKTIDFKFNVEFLKTKFAHVDLTLIENARHELFNESEPLRNHVFSHVFDYLKT